MAIVLKDRVKETSVTAGTGTITLDGAVTGFQAFSAIGNGNVTYFAIVDNATGAWEVNYGTYSSGTLTRNATPLSSSNAGALVSFTSNPKDVFCTYPSEKAIYEETTGNVLIDGVLPPVVYPVPLLETSPLVVYAVVVGPMLAAAVYNAILNVSGDVGPKLWTA